MAELIPTITNGKQENTMLELVRKCDPLMRQPHIMELSKVLPSIQDVYVSYVKLRELCTSDSTREFMVSLNLRTFDLAVTNSNIRKKKISFKILGSIAY